MTVIWTWDFKMAARDDLTNKIFNNLLAMKYVETKNTHAIWECKCLLCGKFTNVTASNLKSGNTKSCASCGQKVTTPEMEKDIISMLVEGEKISNIAKQFNICRNTVYRIKREALS